MYKLKKPEIIPVEKLLGSVETQRCKDDNLVTYSSEAPGTGYIVDTKEGDVLMMRRQGLVVIGLLLVAVPSTGRLKADKDVAHLHTGDEKLLLLRHDFSGCLSPMLGNFLRCMVIAGGIANHALPVAIVFSGVDRASGGKDLSELLRGQGLGGVALLHQTL